MANEKFSALPYNLEAEQSLLGCILVDLEIQLETVSELREEDFYTDSHKLIFNAMKDIARVNKPIDIVTLSDMMEKNATLEKAGGMDYITTIVQSMPSSANYRQYLSIVKRDSTLRRLIRSSELIIKDAKNSTDSKKSLEFAEGEIFKISEENETSSLLPLADFYDPLLADLEHLERDKDFNRGLKTGFNHLDNLTNGFKKGNLVILAARPSCGKTTLALNMIEHVAIKEKKVCAMFALEMTREELAQKLLCSIGKVKMDSLQKGRLSEDDENGWKRMWEAKKRLKEAPIYVDDSPANTIPAMISKCRRLKATHGLDFIVVDHIQLIYPDHRTAENRQQEVTEISRGLKVMAKELGVPVLALSQLSRGVEQRKGKPVLSDLRESGSIEQDADIVMFIHRPDKSATAQELASGLVEKNVAEVILQKNRSGELGTVKLLFKGEFSKFVNISNYQLEEPGEYRPSTPEDDHPAASGGFNSFDDVFDDPASYDESDIPPDND
ncbi:MAG: replicative DNA helicase [Clostridia bacterium]|nr:replicative DNA helicase [Clostridia bacterium]